MYLVSIEWDGKKPPSKFYDRMRDRFGLTVRGNGDKSESPLKRRTSQRAMDMAETAVVFQEGAIYCTSEALARTIYMYAIEFKAKSVAYWYVEKVEFHVTVEDAKIMDDLEGKFSKRGRPAGPKLDFVVTCHDQGMTFPLKDEYYAVTCPACSSTRVHARQGEIANFAFPDDGHVFEAWKRHRFVTGYFEVPDDGNTLPPLNPNPVDPNERRVIEMIPNSAGLWQDITAMKPKQAAAFLDALLCCRAHISSDARRKARVETAVLLYERGVTTAQVPLMESPTILDLLDASAIVGPEKVAAVWLALHQGGQP